MERGIRIIGNGQAPVHLYWHDLLQMIRDGKTDPLAMLSHCIQLEEMEEEYRIFDNRGDNMQRFSCKPNGPILPRPGLQS